MNVLKRIAIWAVILFAATNAHAEITIAQAIKLMHAQRLWGDAEGWSQGVKESMTPEFVATLKLSNGTPEESRPEAERFALELLFEMCDEVMEPDRIRKLIAERLASTLTPSQFNILTNFNARTKRIFKLRDEADAAGESDDYVYERGLETVEKISAERKELFRQIFLRSGAIEQVQGNLFIYSTAMHRGMISVLFKGDLTLSDERMEQVRKEIFTDNVREVILNRMVIEASYRFRKLSTADLRAEVAELKSRAAIPNLQADAAMHQAVQGVMREIGFELGVKMAKGRTLDII